MFKYSLLSIAMLGTMAILPQLVVAAPPDRPTSTMTLAQVEASLPRAHPAEYYLYAQRLFQSGRKDDAVFWFYVGQLRYRFYLSANPKLPESGDPAVFASLNDSIGRSINEYAGGNPTTWVVAIDRALAWDKISPNYFTSKQQFPAQYNGITTGLSKLREMVQSEAENIKNERTNNGLPNR
jgi:hypothetical protein